MKTKHRNTVKIVAAMCKHGFMNGWFGDVSEEFQAEQVEWLDNMSDKEYAAWIDRNKFNLTTYCGIQYF